MNQWSKQNPRNHAPLEDFLLLAPLLEVSADRQLRLDRPTDEPMDGWNKDRYQQASYVTKVRHSFPNQIVLGAWCALHD